MKKRGVAIGIGAVAGLILVTGLGVLTWPKTDEPMFIYNGPQKPAGYVDIDNTFGQSMLLTAVSTEGNVEYWVRDESPEGDVDARLRSMRTRIEYDCEESRYRVLEIERFAGPNLTKRYDGAWLPFQDWMWLYPRSHSADEYLLAFACGRRQPL